MFSYFYPNTSLNHGSRVVPCHTHQNNIRRMINKALYMTTTARLPPVISKNETRVYQM